MKRTAALVLVAAACAQGVTLVDQGKSPYTIVVAANASPSERRAAQELQRFIEEMSGAKLPVVTDAKDVRGPKVLVGDSAAVKRLGVQLPLADLGPEGFVLRTRGPNIIIAGGRQRGTMYGATAFLEKLGCRWFTSEVSRIPKTPTIRIDTMDVTEKPAFEYREPFFTEAFEKEWAARNRTNGDHSKLDASTGGKLQYYPFVHSFYELLPPDRYFASHPEYYSLIDGKRRFDRGQLCLTNAEVLRIATERVEQWIREHPEATIFSVSQNDWEGWCECDRCRRVEEEEGGKHMGPVLRFVNALAERIGQKHPDKLIDTIAYWYTEEPPLKARPVKNVRIRLCPIGICTSHSFASCPRSAYFQRNLKAWAEITSQLYIWHYNTNFSHYLLPFPDLDELSADIPIYQKNGVVGLFMQGAYAAGGGGEMAGLKSYLLARLLWNPAVDANAVIDEYLKGVYGKAAPQMKAYLELLHREVRPGPAGLGKHLWIFAVPDYSDGLLKGGMELFRQAEAAAGDAATRKRIEKDRLSLEYLALLRAREYQVRGNVYAPADLAGLKKQASDFLAQAREHGIGSLHEGRDLNFDEEYYAALREQPALTLENRAWRTVIVPGLGGRAVQLIDKAKGRDLLRQAPPGERTYPDVAGISAGVYPDQHGRQWDVQWEVEAASEREVRLKGAGPDGIMARRWYRLEPRGLATRTEVMNTSQQDKPVALQVRADLAPADIDTESVTFRAVSGEEVRRRLIVPEKEPAGREMWEGAKLPAGEWRLRETGTVNWFAGAQRALVTWSVKARPGAAFTLWSPETTLRPGESVAMDASYGR
jgi:hypothetical protein